ncbi:MAG: hypothetical protein ABIB71_02920 [Candidatus Woesearchaeota archaeon]
MDRETHILIAKAHFEIAEKEHKKHESAEGKPKIAVRCVAAQNYFYSAISFIEAKLAEKELHSFSHENRARKVLENNELFSEDAVRLFDQIDRNIRNKVAYRGENGKKYKLIREFASLMVKEAK